MTLVISNGDKRRQKEQSLYKRRCKDLDRFSRELRDFENHDVPAYQLWVETELGDLIKVYHQGVSELSRLCDLISIVKDYARLKGIPQRQAYVLVVASQKNGTPLWEEEDDVGNDDEPFGSNGDDDFFKVFADFIDNSDDDHSGRERPESRASENTSKSSDSTSLEYLKTVYRKLVRILHPDANGGTESTQTELWQQVQDAYSWRDIQHLETILNKMTGDEQKILDLKIIPISHIIDLRRDVEKRLLSLKSRIADAKQEGAWRFRLLRSKKQGLSGLKKELKYDLETHIQDVKHELARYQRQVKMWEKPTSEKKQEPAKKRSSKAEKGSFRKICNDISWIFDEI